MSSIYLGSDIFQRVCLIPTESLKSIIGILFMIFEKNLIVSFSGSE